MEDPLSRGPEAGCEGESPVRPSLEREVEEGAKVSGKRAVLGGYLRLCSVALFSAVLLSGACTGPQGGQGEESGDREDSKRLVVTTVAPITSIVKAVAGEKATVVGIIPEGEDSHTYEPRPQVAQDFAAADVIFFNGLNLETPAIELAERSRKPETKLVFLAEETITPDSYVFDFSFPREKGDPNPHLWLNPMYAAKYAEIAARELQIAYPDDGDYFRQRYVEYRRALDELDEAIFAAVATIPAEKRKLLTYHDSFAYFAPRYGFQVVGAVQPSDFKEPSAAEVAAIVDQIRAEGVSAIFGSEVYPSPVMEQIARETGARYVTDLSDDTLPGEEDSPEHNYIGMMVRNVESITQALGGDPSALRSVDVYKGGKWS